MGVVTKSIVLVSLLGGCGLVCPQAGVPGEAGRAQEELEEKVVCALSKRSLLLQDRAGVCVCGWVGGCACVCAWVLVYACVYVCGGVGACLYYWQLFTLAEWLMFV